MNQEHSIQFTESEINFLTLSMTRNEYKFEIRKDLKVSFAHRDMYRISDSKISLNITNDSYSSSDTYINKDGGFAEV